VGLILFGTQETKNDLAGDGYSHVVVLRDVITPDVDLLTDIEKIRPGGSDGDCTYWIMPHVERGMSNHVTAVVDALVVGMDLLVKKVGNRNYQKRVFLITDAGCDVNEDDLHTILDKFNEINAVLNVIGVDFADEEDQQDRSHVSETKEHNEKLIQKMCERVRGRVIPIQNALDLLSFTSSKSIVQKSNYRGWFEISRHVRIPVWSFAKTKEDTFPRMAKISRLSQESANPDTMAVKPERSYHPMDDPDREVPFEQLSKGYRYGKTLVPFDRIDLQNLKFTSSACLQLLGFCSKDSVPRQHFMGPVDAVVPLPADDTASEAMSALVQALENSNSVAIVRFVKRANGAPQLGVLTPYRNASKGYQYLHFNKLPLHEDLRQYTFASLGENAPRKSHQPSQPQLDAMEDLINSMDLTVNANGDQEEALKPKRTYNPALQHFFACVQSRALHPERPLPPLDPLVEQYVNPDKHMLERAARAIDAVKETFHLVKTEQKEKEGKRRFWSDAFAEAAAGVQLDSYVNDDAKRQKLHDGLPEGGRRLSIQSLISEVTDVGSATPVEDFNAMIARKDVDLVDKAIEQMQRQIVKLVNESVRDSYYSKALDCLKALRKGCVDQAEVEPFNKFLADMKKNYRGSKRDEFWRLIQSESVSLITAEESSDSDFTEADAYAFLTTDVIPGYLVSELDGDEDHPQVAPRPRGDEVEAEDLFDMIE
jgi:ATP-dependent DNA helicase 2 subunit 2